MTGARHQLFAGAGFTLDQQWRIEGGNALGAGLQAANRCGVTEQRVEAFGMVVVQRRQAFADAARRIQAEQTAGQLSRAAVDALGDRLRIQQQRLALERDLAHRQAETLVVQRLV